MCLRKLISEQVYKNPCYGVEAIHQQFGLLLIRLKGDITHNIHGEDN